MQTYYLGNNTNTQNYPNKDYAEIKLFMVLSLKTLITLKVNSAIAG